MIRCKSFSSADTKNLSSLSLTDTCVCFVLCTLIFCSLILLEVTTIINDDNDKVMNKPEMIMLK